MWRVEKFCHCINLRIGAFIAAAYSAIYFGVSCFVIGKSFDEKFEQNWTSFIDVPTVLSCLLMVCSIVGLVSVVLLVVGLLKEISALLILWISMLATDAVIDAVYLVFLLFMPASTKDRSFNVLMVFDFAVWAFNVHCLLCVLSLYHKLKPTNNENLESVEKVMLSFKANDNIELDSA